MDKIRWGIMGTGIMAHRFAGDMLLSETGRLVAVASRDPQNAKKFAKNVTGYPSYADLAASDEIDAIYVATPNACHRDHCILALEGGKAVLCEKPLATNAEDGRAIADAANAAGKFCMEGMWTTFLPGFAQIREAVTRGKIGQPLHAHATLGFARKEAAGDPITDPTLGGGALLDVGVYCVAMLTQLLGSAKIVSGQVSRSDTGSIRSCTAMLTHDGVHSSFATSHEANFPNRLEITGTRGRVEVSAPFIQAQSARIWTFESQLYAAQAPQSALAIRVKSSRIWPKSRKIAKIVLGSSGKRVECDYVGTGLQYQIDELGRALENGKQQSDVFSLGHSISILKILDKLDTSKGFQPDRANTQRARFTK